MEWAPDSVLEDALSLLDTYDIKATLFSTHDDPFDEINHERGIHPNFDKDGDPEAVLDEICTLYPEATGVRSHRMQISTALRDQFISRGIEYESNYIMYKVDNIYPFLMPKGTVQLPVYWMDDMWFKRDKSEISVEKLLDSPGMKIFDFHPPHICFNTPSQEYYSKHKDRYWATNPDIDALRYKGYGVRDVFLRILEYIDKNDINTYTMNELTHMYLEEDCRNWPVKNITQ